MHHSFSVSILVLATGLSAQSYFMPSNTPTTGTCNTIPFGQTSFIYQTMATNKDLGSSTALPISEIAFTPCSGSGVIHFDKIEVTLSQTSASALGTTFANNLVFNTVVVLSATDYDWHVSSGVWNRLGLDKDYLYFNTTTYPNLVIQIVATGIKRTGVSTTFHRDSTHPRMYALNWTTAPPATGSLSSAGLKFEVSSRMADLGTFGRGCAGSNGTPALTLSGSAKPNGSLGMTVSNCPATTPLIHNFGITRFAGGIDLQIIKAPGCILYETTDVLGAGISDSSGVYTRKVTVPTTSSLLGGRIYTQAFPRDAKANTWGFSSSNYGRILVGN